VGKTWRRRRTARDDAGAPHRGAQGCRHPLARQRRGGAIARGVRSLAFTGDGSRRLSGTRAATTGRPCSASLDAA
jgi:hypothetical protein